MARTRKKTSSSTSSSSSFSSSPSSFLRHLLLCFLCLSRLLFVSFFLPNKAGFVDGVSAMEFSVPFASRSGMTAPNVGQFGTTEGGGEEEEDACPAHVPSRMKAAAKILVDGMPERMLPKPSQIFKTVDVTDESGTSSSSSSSNANKGVPERIARRVKFKRCAVVGNGGILKSAEFGKAIDAHDVVFRQNQAPTATYEAFVGEKTTFRVLNKKWTQQYSRGDKDYLPLEKDVYLIASRGIDKIARNLVKAYPQRPDVRVVGLESAVRGAVGKLMREFKSKADKCLAKGFKPKGGNTPSSGIISTVMAMSLCDEVNLYGFGVDDRNVGRGWRNQLPSALPPEAKYQYYVLRGTERSGVDAVHSMELEHAILDGLVGAGYINRCGAGKETCGLTPKKKVGRLGNRKDLLKAESMFNAREIMMREKASKGKDEREEYNKEDDDNDAVSTTGKAFYGDTSNENNADDKIEEAGELDEHLSDDELDEDDALTKMMNYAAKGVKYLFSSTSHRDDDDDNGRSSSYSEPSVLDEDDPFSSSSSK